MCSLVRRVQHRVQRFLAKPGLPVADLLQWNDALVGHGELTSCSGRLPLN
jgi:hypothetical protein